MLPIASAGRLNGSGPNRFNGRTKAGWAKVQGMERQTGGEAHAIGHAVQGSQIPRGKIQLEIQTEIQTGGSVQALRRMKSGTGHPRAQDPGHRQGADRIDIIRPRR